MTAQLAPQRSLIPHLLLLLSSKVCITSAFLHPFHQNEPIRSRTDASPSPSRLLFESDVENMIELESNIVECYLPTPNPDIPSHQIVTLCMNALQENNEPYVNAGLETCFNFSSDRCRAALGGDLETFIKYANNPTFGSMIECTGWTVLSTGPIIPGTPTRGAMQTVLVDLVPKTGRTRKFLWTLQKERRPPRDGCWLIHEVIFTENAYSLTL